MRVNHNIYLYITILCQILAMIAGKAASINFGYEKLFLYIMTLFILGIQAFFWQKVLSYYTISRAYFIYGIVFFFVLILVNMIFNEKISVLNILGLSIITIGMYRISRKKKI